MDALNSGKIEARQTDDVKSNETTLDQINQKTHALSSALSSAAPSASTLLPQVTTQPNPTPQIFFNEEGNIVVIKPAPIITKLTLQGGGPKGLAYGPYLKEMNQRYHSASGNFLEGLQDISGSSAGAMMSYLLAAGVSIEEVNAFMNQVDMSNELKGSLNVAGLQTTEWAPYEAGKITETLKLMAVKSVNGYMSQIARSQLAEIKENLQQKGFQEHQIADFLERYYNWGFSDGITFGDLAILHELNPAKFKRLHLTGCTEKSYEIRYYNAANQFDMPGHAAVRISMALPFAIAAVSWKGETLSDGGQASNVPSEAFAKGQIASSPGDLLVLVFRNEKASTDSYEILYGPPRDEPEEPNQEQWKTKKWNEFEIMRRKKRVEATDKWDSDKIYAAGSNVGVVPHGTLTTTSFWADSQEIQIAAQEVEIAVKEFCEQRANQAIANEFTSEIEAIQSLSSEEQKALLAEKKEQLLEFENRFKEAEKQLDTAQTELDRIKSQLESPDIAVESRQSLAESYQRALTNKSKCHIKTITTSGELESARKLFMILEETV
jgi:exoenzyme U